MIVNQADLKKQDRRVAELLQHRYVYSELLKIKKSPVELLSLSDKAYKADLTKNKLLQKESNFDKEDESEGINVSNIALIGVAGGFIILFIIFGVLRKKRGK